MQLIPMELPGFFPFDAYAKGLDATIIRNAEELAEFIEARGPIRRSIHCWTDLAESTYDYMEQYPLNEENMACNSGKKKGGKKPAGK